MSVLKPIDSGGIMLSYRCQCGCAHCVYACGPKWRTWMSPDYLEDLLKSIPPEWVSPKGLHLAGGEAFLNFSLLLRAVELCNQQGLPLEYVETNGGWCTTAEEAEEKFSLLKEAGLSRVLISVSPFHAETIPLVRSEMVISAAQRVFGPENVIVYMDYFREIIARFDYIRPVPLRRWIEALGEEGAGRLFWEGYALIPGGRAGFRLGELSPYRKPWQAFAQETCAYEILQAQHAHIDPYGHYIPLFCGGLSLGRVESLPGFVSSFDLEKLPLVSLLVQQGPYGLGCYAQKEWGFVPNPKGYAGKCHLCVEVRKYLVDAEAPFSELAPREFYTYL